MKNYSNLNITGQTSSIVYQTARNGSIGHFVIKDNGIDKLYDGLSIKVMFATEADTVMNSLSIVRANGTLVDREYPIFIRIGENLTNKDILVKSTLNLTFLTIDDIKGWYADAVPNVEIPDIPTDFGKIIVRDSDTGDEKVVDATEIHDSFTIVAGDNIKIQTLPNRNEIILNSENDVTFGTLNTTSISPLPVSLHESFGENIRLHKISKTGNYNDLNNKPTIPTVPTEISAFNNDVGYITLNDVPQQVNADWNSDSGVSEILNKPTIHTYTAGEGIEISQNDVISCTVEQDTDHAHLEHLDYESSGHTGFQPTLSGQNAGTDISITVVNGIPKINNTQVPVQPSWGNITGTLANQTDLQNALNAKQDILSSANEGDDISITLVNGVPKINVINIQGDISDIQDDISDIVSDISDINSDISDLQSDVGTIQSYIPSNASTSNQLAVHSDITTIQGNITSIDGRVTTIEGKIPTQASTTNQLADKEFVNSSIATNTANFIGTFSNVSSLLAYNGTLTNNDYAFVMNSVITNNGSDWTTFSDLDNFNKDLITNFDYAWVINGTKFDLYRFDITTQTWSSRATNINKTDVTLVTAYNRYKYNGDTSEWIWEYTLNNSSFTASQWAAINSTITSAKVVTYDGYQAQINNKQDSLTPGSGISISNNVISATPEWGDITGTLSSQTDLQTALGGKQNTLTPGTGVNISNDVISVTPPVWGNITGVLSNQTDLQTALGSKQNTLTAGSGISLQNGNINTQNIIWRTW